MCRFDKEDLDESSVRLSNMVLSSYTGSGDSCLVCTCIRNKDKPMKDNYILFKINCLDETL